MSSKNSDKSISSTFSSKILSASDICSRGMGFSRRNGGILDCKSNLKSFHDRTSYRHIIKAPAAPYKDKTNPVALKKHFIASNTNPPLCDAQYSSMVNSVYTTRFSTGVFPKYKNRFFLFIGTGPKTFFKR